jgi:hypothetical protein
MSVVVVGGHSRNIGKTTVAASLIAALPNYNWTAIKITQHGHGICSAVGAPCDCAVEYDHPYALSEETAPGSTDSARFLTAGARRSYWLRTASGQLGNAVDKIREIVGSGENTMIESNSILQFWKPDLYIVVLDFATADFKDSALRYLDRADCVVPVGEGEPRWHGVSRRLWESKPRHSGSDLAGFVAQRLERPKPDSTLRSASSRTSQR